MARRKRIDIQQVERDEEKPQPAVQQSVDWEKQCWLAERLNNASIDSLIALDTNLVITAWNDTAAEWFGRSKEEAVGRSLYEVFPKARNKPELQEAIENALKGFKSFIPSTSRFYPEGYYEAHFVPLREKDGSISGVLHVLHDVAHRVKAENELKELNRQLSGRFRELQRANEELATFTKVASHDLKEPLRKIYIFAEMIITSDGSKLSNTSRANFRRIQSASHRMALLTDAIVNFSEINASKEKPDDVELDKILMHACESLQEPMTNSGAQIVTQGLPVIKGYRNALEQLFVQLLGNAIKFQPRDNTPKVEISCDRVSGGELRHPEAVSDLSYYRLSFKDNGIGFDQQFAERIFGMFQRLDQESKFKGSGVGLAIARKVSEMHSGFITAESTPGEGSTFCCYLPEN